MGRWIRWQGLVAFLVLAALLGAFWFLAAGRLVVMAIEKAGTELVGAKVELDAADVTLFPLGLHLKRLQVTDPDRGMENAVEVAEVEVSLDAVNLLRRKVIVDTLDLSGIRLHTPRTVSGALPGREEQGATAPGTSSGFELPSLAIPDVEAILAGEELESLAEIERLKAEIQAIQDGWRQRLETLPDQGRFAEYRARIEALRKGGAGGIQGVLQKGGEVKALQEELRRDREAVAAALRDSQDTLGSVKARIAAAKTAPLADLERIREKYSLSPEGMAHLTRLLLGGKIAGSVDTALAWYRRLAPLYAQARGRTGATGPEVVKPLRAQGVDVRFRERVPVPEFLVRDTHLSLLLDAGEFAGTIRNLTHQQDILGLPTTFTLAGLDLAGIGDAQVDGTLDHVSPGNPKDAFQARVSGFEANGLVLSDAPQLPLTLQQGLADFEAEGSVQGEDLSVDLTARLNSADLALGATAGTSRITEAIGSALAGVSEFSLAARIRGTLEQYDVEVRSDLDTVFNDAVGNLVREEAARMEAELKPAILAKVEGPLAELQGGLGGLEAVNGEVAGRGNTIDELLQSAVAKPAPGGLKLPFPAR
jgi:uncharacterized protein (TIGR03545 family)